jgi:hypothetical protein
VAAEDLPDGRGADAVAEVEQLTLNPQVSPPWVLPRHPHHHGDDGSSIGGRPVRFG